MKSYWNDHALFFDWYDYVLATKTMPIEAQAFQAWYFALYPDKLNPEVGCDTICKFVSQNT